MTAAPPARQPAILARLALLGLLLAAGCGAADPPPNLIVVMLDDTRADGIDRMPTVQARLAGQGVSFRQSFVPCSTCCPSRASFLTGRYARRHGTRATSGWLGGADRFRADGADRQTIAVWLHDAGYTTGLFGKYLNEYRPGPGGEIYVPPGWDRWRVFAAPEHMGGALGYPYRIVDERGTVTPYTDRSSDAQYSTDLHAQWLREFIAEAAAAKRPFFAVWAPHASHGDPAAPAPALRHQQAFADLTPWRPPSWAEPDIGDKPQWVGTMPPDRGTQFTDTVRRRAFQSLLAVDEQIGRVLAQLEQLGIAERTVIVLTSDNGSAWGEHRQFVQAKGCPYEECIRVPLVIRPAGGGAPRLCDAPVLNIDLAPTLAALAGVTIPVDVDGEPLNTWLAGGSVPEWRRDFLLEYARDQRRSTIGYRGQPHDGDQVRLFFGPTDARPRASHLFEFDADGTVGPSAIAVPIGATPALTFFALGDAAGHTVPATAIVQLQDEGLLIVADIGPDHAGVIWREERDAADVLRAAIRPAGPPDYLGVRDVARGYTYVDYETGEIELYDLEADPWQLDNRAADPAYAALRAELAARLDALRRQTAPAAAP